MLLEPPSVYLKEYALVDEASDSVRVFVGANHECVALLCYDKAITAFMLSGSLTMQF